MKLKTYHSESVEAAVRLAGVELGDDAIFLGSRENTLGDRAGYEVTFAVMESPAPGAQTASEPAAARDAPSGAAALSAGRKAAPHSARGVPAQAARAAAGATQTRLSSSAGTEGTEKRIERPHWKKYVPENLEANLKRPPLAGDGSLGQNNQARARGGEDVPPKGNSAPATAQSSVAAAAPAGDSAAASAPAGVATSEPPSSGAAAATSILGLGRPGTAPSASMAAAPVAKLEPDRDSSGSAPPAAAGDWRGISASTGAAARLRSPSLARVQEELLEIRRLLEERPRPLPPSSWPLLGGLAPSDSLLANQYARLAQNGVDPWLLLRLFSPLLPAAEIDQKDDWESRLRAALESLCPASAELGDPNAAVKVCAFVGPSGAGKTSCAVKLAVHYGWQRGLRVQLVSLGPHRLGAAQQLQAYARVAEIPITTVEDASELGPALDRAGAAEQRPDLVIIDTPSYAPSEPGRAAQAAQALCSRPGIDRHLVVSLSGSQAGQKRALDSCGAFGATKLLFTKLDECSAPGAILNGLAYAQLPVSFISTGPGVPEDIRPASPAYLAELMLKT